MKGQIRARGKGTYTLILYLGRDANGKKRQKWITFKGTKRAAEAELARLVNEVNTGQYVEPSRTTLAEYLERWLKDFAKAAVGPKTYERYEEIVRKHLIPNLGHVALEKLQPMAIQAYYTAALQRGRLDRLGGLSAQTVLHHHRVLHAALKQAVKWQLLARNPADAVEPPRVEQREMRALDEDEVQKLLAAAKGTRMFLPLLIALTTGLRRGEICGLTWNDIDLQAGTLTVRQALSKTRELGLQLKRPKTKRSRRTLDLPEVTIEALRRHRAEQNWQKRMLGDAYHDMGLVICRDDGQPLDPDRITQGFAALCKRTGIPEVRFHDTRHTHAALLILLGEHYKLISDRLGHAKAGFTLDTYGHLLPGMQKEAARKLNQLLRRERGVAPE